MLVALSAQLVDKARISASSDSIHSYLLIFDGEGAHDTLIYAPSGRQIPSHHHLLMSVDGYKPMDKPSETSS